MKKRMLSALLVPVLLWSPYGNAVTPKPVKTVDPYNGDTRIELDNVISTVCHRGMSASAGSYPMKFSYVRSKSGNELYLWSISNATDIPNYLPPGSTLDVLVDGKSTQLVSKDGARVDLNKGTDIGMQMMFGRQLRFLETMPFDASNELITSLSTATKVQFRINAKDPIERCIDGKNLSLLRGFVEAYKEK